MRVVTTAITIFTEVLLSLWVPLTAAVEMAATRSDAPPWPMALSWRESTDVDGDVRRAPCVALIAAQAPDGRPSLVHNAERAHVDAVHVVLEVDPRDEAEGRARRAVVRQLEHVAR